jgi:hypothetical protein
MTHPPSSARIVNTEIVRLPSPPLPECADPSFPPDFDPSKIKRRKGLKKQNGSQMTVRLMSPYSMRCSKCGEYICEFSYLVSCELTADKGKKFNARKETAVGEEYLGIKVFRFYIVSGVGPGGSVLRSASRLWQPPSSPGDPC